MIQSSRLSRGGAGDPGRADLAAGRLHTKKEAYMGDKSPKNVKKQQQTHEKKKEEQKKKPAQPSIKK